MTPINDALAFLLLLLLHIVRQRSYPKITCGFAIIIVDPVFCAS